MSEQQKTEAKVTDKRTVPVTIISKRFGSKPTSSLQTVDVQIVGNDTIRLDLTIALRNADSIEIYPLRRDIDDVDGLIEDAERLANS